MSKNRNRDTFIIKKIKTRDDYNGLLQNFTKNFFFIYLIFCFLFSNILILIFLFIRIFNNNFYNKIILLLSENNDSFFSFKYLEDPSLDISTSIEDDFEDESFGITVKPDRDFISFYIYSGLNISIVGYFLGIIGTINWLAVNNTLKDNTILYILLFLFIGFILSYDLFFEFITGIKNKFKYIDTSFYEKITKTHKKDSSLF